MLPRIFLTQPTPTLKKPPVLLDAPLPPAAEAAWTPADAEDLYRIDAWGDGYFFINDLGHVAVTPSRDRAASMDLHEVVENLRGENVTFPLLIRFQGVLRSRVVQLNEAFRQAIDAFDYRSRYVGVYPIKVNQLHEVVEEVLEAGQPYGMGLECGSKAELIAALAHLEHDGTPLICNGYKDNLMLRLILTGQLLGKHILPVVEKYEEFERLLRLAREMKVRPRFGVRVALATHGSGKWAASSGDLSKFGISIPELVTLVERLRQDDLAEALALLHFHLGSQIADIQTLKAAVKEITQVYAQLHARGVPVQYIDVGGGLGVNYEAGYIGQNESINYTLQEYANSVVYAVKEVCDAEKAPHPMLISESGRALTAHHSVLIVEVLGAYRKREIDPGFVPAEDAHAVVHELYDALVQAQGENGQAQPRPSRLLEVYHDAVENRDLAHSLFGLGYLPLEHLALAERLYWSACRTIHQQKSLLDPEAVPAELRALDDHLIDQYLCNFSVFQSILDHWAIGQRFPIMPIHRLTERPTRRAQLVDLTCDSDGKVSRYLDANGEKQALEVHALQPTQPYYLGFFLMGAYQDIMGDMHNLFGRVSEVHVYADEEDGYYIEKRIPGASVEEMLALVQYFPNDLHRRMDALIRRKAAEGVIRPKAGVQILQEYVQAFQEQTYFNTRNK